MTGTTGVGRIASALTAALLLASCSGGDVDQDPTPATSSSSSAPAPESTPAVEPLTMLDACPEIEAALPESRGVLPGPGSVLDFDSRLDELEAGGDTEVQNAIALIRPAVQDVLSAGAATGVSPADELEATLAARRTWRDAISAVASRCARAGSSALQ